MNHDQLKFLRFIKEAGLLGGGSAALAILLLAISIYEHSAGNNVPAYWLVFLATVFFGFGAFEAWKNANDRSEKSDPQLNIEIIRVFFDSCRLRNTNRVQIYLFAHLRVTNWASVETTIKDGTMQLAIDGQQYSGRGDDISQVGNALEHRSNYRIGGETSDDIFGNTTSPFTRLPSETTAHSPLKKGIPQTGFFVFAFPSLSTWTNGTQWSIDATKINLTLRDSFNRNHYCEISSLRVEAGKLINSTQIE